MDEIILNQFQRHIKAGDKASARKLISQYLKDNPNDADGWYLAATVAGKEQRVNLLNKALAVDPFHEKSHQTLVRLQSEPELTPAIKPNKTPSQSKSRWYLIAIILIVGILGGLWVGARYLNNSQANLSFEEQNTLSFEEQMEVLKDYLYSPHIPNPSRTNTRSSFSDPFLYDPQKQLTEGMTRDSQHLYVHGVIRNMTGFMREADQLNQTPRRNEEWILVGVTSECISHRMFCLRIIFADFILINRVDNTIYQMPTMDGFLGIDEISLLKTGPAEIDELRAGFLAFIVPKNVPTHDLILVHSPFDPVAINQVEAELGSLPWEDWVNYINEDISAYFELVDLE